MGKSRVDDLAIFGGQPTFPTVRPIGQLALPDRQKFFGYAREIFQRRRLTNNGPVLQMLEARLAELHDVNHCVAFANATIALIVLIRHLAGSRRGEVIMPAFTYPGLPHIAQWAGQLPRFCDIDRATHALSPAATAEALNEQTTVILGVHQVNSPCFIDEFTEISARSGVPLIFDSVHGVMCTHQGKPLGGFGAAEVFSLHATKLINGFEGGYITTNDSNLAEALCRLRNFGFTGEDTVVDMGLNGKLNELHAAAALSCLDSLDSVADRNRERYEAYQAAFSGLPGLDWVRYDDTGQRPWNYEFSLLDVGKEWSLTRDDTVQLLRMENALARPYYSPPLHLSAHCPAGIEVPNLPVTEELAGRFIQMPVGELVSLEDIKELSDLFAFFRDNGPEITERLNSVEAA